MLVKVFPYHLSDYVCRIMRLTPFKYNVDVLFTVMRAEKSYDSIPNFLVSPLRFLIMVDQISSTLRCCALSHT